MDMFFSLRLLTGASVTFTTIVYGQNSGFILYFNPVEKLQQTRECTGCNLTETNWRAANLAGVKLLSTNFSGANLREANLRGAILQWAILENADLRDANLCNTRIPNGTVSSRDC